jgi:two-component system, chemotaxis family, sensor kinase CheA
VYIFLILALIASFAGIANYSVRLEQATDLNNKRINLAGRQRALSQRMTKALLAYHSDSRAGLPTDDTLSELKKVSGIFNSVIIGFDRGTKVPGTDGKEFFLPAVNESEERRIVQGALELWLPLYDRLKEVAAGSATPEQVTATVAMARMRNVPIFDLMNELTNRTEFTARQAVNAASGPRNILIAFASIVAFLIPGVFLINRAAKQRKRAEGALTSLEGTYKVLDRQAAALSAAKAGTDRIMETVQEGLFLVDEKGVIGEHYSQELAVILRENNLAGMNIFNILQRHLSDKMHNTTRVFFALLFNASRKEKTVLKVNPLTDVEVNFPNPEGGFITRHLGFSFRRIMLDGKVDRVFVALRDVTVQVELERKLHQAEKTKEREMEILLSIVHVPKEDLEVFAGLAQKELNTINETLRAEDFAASAGRHDALKSRLKTIYSSIHNLNGNAALLGLLYFQKAAHDFESKIKDLLDRPNLSGDDFLSIVIAQAALRSDLTDLQNLRTKLGSSIGAVAPPAAVAPAAAPVSWLAEQLRQLVKTGAKDLDRSASLTVDEFALHAFAPGARSWSGTCWCNSPVMPSPMVWNLSPCEKPQVSRMLRRSRSMHCRLQRPASLGWPCATTVADSTWNASASAARRLDYFLQINP